MILGMLSTSILGLELLKGKAWMDSKGNKWRYGDLHTSFTIRSQTSSIRDCKYKTAPLTTGCKRGDHRHHVIQTHSLYNSPVWPVRKPNGKWQVTTDYRCLNANTGPLTAVSTIQKQSKKELQYTLEL